MSKSDVACLILASLIAYQPSPALAQQVADDTTSTAKVSETTEPAAGTDAASPENPKKWKFATIGYGWFAGAKGETDIIGPVPPVDLDLSFGDALKALKFAFMGAAEARHDRIVILGDLVFIHLKAHDGIGIRDPDFLKATLDSRTSELTLIGGYRVVNHGPVTVDLLAGGRMNWFKTSLELEGPNRSAEGTVKKNWLDPVVAVRTLAPLGGKWTLSLYGDLGGFGVGSKITWQAIGAVTYDISKKMRVGGGWRAFKVNYRDGDFLYDVAQSGPIIVFRTDF